MREQLASCDNVELVGSSQPQLSNSFLETQLRFSNLVNPLKFGFNRKILANLEGNILSATMENAFDKIGTSFEAMLAPHHSKDDAFSHRYFSNSHISDEVLLCFKGFA